MTGLYSWLGAMFPTDYISDSCVLQRSVIASSPLVFRQSAPVGRKKASTSYRSREGGGGRDWGRWRERKGNETKNNRVRKEKGMMSEQFSVFSCPASTVAIDGKNKKADRETEWKAAEVILKKLWHIIFSLHIVFSTYYQSMWEAGASNHEIQKLMDSHKINKFLFSFNFGTVVNIVYLACMLLCNSKLSFHPAPLQNLLCTNPSCLLSHTFTLYVSCRSSCLSLICHFTLDILLFSCLLLQIFTSLTLSF